MSVDRVEQPRLAGLKFLVMVAAGLLATACANAPLQSSSTSEVYRPGQSPSSVPAQGPSTQTPTTMTRPQTAPSAPVYVRPPETNNAAAALLRDANVALSNNDLSRAVSNAERAQRVAPRDPAVYLTLSRIRCVQESYGQCEQLARKALSLQPSLDQREEAQRLIATAKTAE
jgi:hypothetical protein